MSIEKEKNNLRDIKEQVPTLEIKSHPSEIMDLDEETVAIAKAKLAGLDFEKIYGDEDRSSPELMVRTQAKKIRELFHTPDDIKVAFSSGQSITQARKDMMIDGICIQFVKDYCKKCQIDFADDAEALIKVGFARDRIGDVNV
jgi:hypothetical protein